MILKIYNNPCMILIANNTQKIIIIIYNSLYTILKIYNSLYNSYNMQRPMYDSYCSTYDHNTCIWTSFRSVIRNENYTGTHIIPSPPISPFPLCLSVCLPPPSLSLFYTYLYQKFKEKLLHNVYLKKNSWDKIHIS